MNDRTRPPLDVEALYEEIRRLNPHVTLQLPDPAAYQPTGPDDLAGLLREITQVASFAGERSFDIDGLARELAARGVTLTGVRSSEACARDGHSWLWTCAECGATEPEPGVRSSEVDGLREALDTIFRAFDKSGNVPMFLAATIRDVRAIAGDTGPRVEPEPRGFQYCIHGVSETQECVDCGGFGWTPEPSNGD